MFHLACLMALRILKIIKLSFKVVTIFLGRGRVRIMYICECVCVCVCLGGGWGRELIGHHVLSSIQRSTWNNKDKYVHK